MFCLKHIDKIKGIFIKNKQESSIPHYAELKNEITLENLFHNFNIYNSVFNIEYLFDTSNGLEDSIIEIKHVLSTYEKSNKDIKEQSFCDSISMIKDKFKPYENKIAGDFIHDLLKKYPHSVELYAYIMQHLINRCFYKTNSSDCYYLMSLVNKSKDFILDVNSPKSAKSIIVKKNPPMSSFGLSPIGSLSSLSDILFRIFKKQGSLKELSKETCFIIINRVIKNPVNFDITPLKKRTQRDHGINQTTIEKFQTINYIETDEKWDFSITTHGSLDSKEFVVLCRFAKDKYKIYSSRSIIQNINVESHIWTNYKLKKEQISNLLTFIKTKTLNSRFQKYHKYQENKILQNMFLSIGFYPTNGYIIQSHFLRYDIQKKIIERLENIIQKDYSKGTKIKNMKDISDIIHHSDLVSIFNSILVEQYDIYAIKNKDNTNIFPYSETFQTFLSVLENMNTDFRRNIHDNFVAQKIKPSILADKGIIIDHREKVKNIMKEYNDIVNNTLVKIINDDRNIYQELINKNHALMT